MEQSNNKGLVTCLVTLAITGVVSVIIPVAVLIVPIVVSIIYNRYDLKYAVAGYLIFLVCCVFLTNQFIAILYVCITLPVSVCVAYFIKAKERMKTSVIAAVGSAFLGFVIFIVYISVTQGVTLTQFILNILEEYMAIDDSITTSLYVLISDVNLFTEYFMTGVLPEAYAGVSTEAMRIYILDLAFEVVNATIPNTIVVYSLLGGFLSYYIAVLRLKKHGENTVKVQPFEMLTVPRTEINAMFIMALLSILLSYMGSDIFTYASNIFLAAFMVTFGIQGYSVIYFYYKKKVYPMIVCILLLIVATIGGVAYWVGFFDNIFKIRMRYIIGNTKGGGEN